MPLYEYACQECRKDFEMLRPMSQATATASCPHCDGRGERRLSVFAAFSTGLGEVASTMAGAGGCGGCSGGACACAG